MYQIVITQFTYIEIYSLLSLQLCPCHASISPSSLLWKRPWIEKRGGRQSFAVLLGTLLVLYENLLIGFESDELFLGTLKTYKIINFVSLSWKKSDLYLPGVELETHFNLDTLKVMAHNLWPKTKDLRLSSKDQSFAQEPVCQ